jgi:hypothetical protein
VKKVKVVTNSIRHLVSPLHNVPCLLVQRLLLFNTSEISSKFVYPCLLKMFQCNSFYVIQNKS